MAKKMTLNLKGLGLCYLLKNWNSWNFQEQVGQLERFQNSLCKYHSMSAQKAIFGLRIFHNIAHTTWYDKLPQQNLTEIRENVTNREKIDHAWKCSST